jgi:hypothetical protein
MAGMADLSLRAKAQQELHEMSWWKRRRYVQAAKSIHGGYWKYLSPEGRNTCVLFVYIQSRPQGLLRA